MGTRNLTIVVHGGEYKVAQYGQWDGYPECGGIEALNFCRKLTDEVFRSRFERNVSKCRFFTNEELEKIDAGIVDGTIPNWARTLPQLNRDVGRGILDMIYESDGGIALENSIDFAADSLFCEWAWLIDLDNNRFEAYEGFNKKPLTENDRFNFLPLHEYCTPDHSYRQIRKVAEWDLSELPNDEDFIAAFPVKQEEVD